LFDKLSLGTFLSIKSSYFKTEFFFNLKNLYSIYKNSSNNIKVKIYKIEKISNVFELELINYINYNKGLVYVELIEYGNLLHLIEEGEDKQKLFKVVCKEIEDFKKIEYLSTKSYKD
jgi:hypothetical protein